MADMETMRKVPGKKMETIGSLGPPTTPGWPLNRQCRAHALLPWGGVKSRRCEGHTDARQARAVRMAGSPSPAARWEEEGDAEAANDISHWEGWSG